MNDTPCFPQWRARIASFRNQLQSLPRQSLSDMQALFAPLLPHPRLQPSPSGPNSRQRIFSLPVTFWLFLWQSFQPDGTCRSAVQHLRTLFCVNCPETSTDEATSAYCQARNRLPLDKLVALRQDAAAAAQQQAPAFSWCGHPVKVVDGSTASLPDTDANQKLYPQSKSQKPGCGFPLLKYVALFCMASGAMLGYQRGNKHQHEIALFQMLWDCLLKAGDVVLGDRGFGSYVTLALLQARQVWGVFRLHQCRPHDMRRGRRLGPNDRLCVWTRPPSRPRYLPAALWELVPATLTVRLVRVRLADKGFRTREVWLVTTLLDPVKYPASELAALYARRWKIELWLRDLKGPLGMDVLRCKSPEMVHKEIEIRWTCYNLTRALMCQSAKQHDAPLDRISFKGTLDAIKTYAPKIAMSHTRKMRRALMEDMRWCLAHDLVPKRPDRREPRATKRRPKPYAQLTKHRRLYKEIPHRDKYRKSHRSLS